MASTCLGPRGLRGIWAVLSCCFLQQCAQEGHQLGDVAANDVPLDILINVTVTVDEPVSRVDDVAPENFRMSFPNSRRDVARRLAKNADVLQRRVANHPGAEDQFAVESGRMHQDSIAAMDHVAHVDRPTTLRHGRLPLQRRAEAPSVAPCLSRSRWGGRAGLQGSARRRSTASIRGAA